MRKHLGLLIFILISLTAQAQPIFNWTQLDQYQGTLTYGEVRALLRDFLIQDDVSARDYVDSLMVVDGNSVKIFSDPSHRSLSYELRLSESPAKQRAYCFKKSAGKTLSGLRIALNARDGASAAVVDQLALRLGNEGAHVFTATSTTLADIVTGINQFSPDMALAIQTSGNSNFIGFIPGAFMKGELSEERFRFRFLHNLASPKLSESAKLIYIFAESFLKITGASPAFFTAKDFDNRVRLIPRSFIGLEGMGSLPNIVARNYFINGAISDIALHSMTPNTATSIQAAEVYYQGILKYVEATPACSSYQATVEKTDL